MLFYTLGCAIVVTFLCGLFPAIRGTRRSIAGELAHASRAQVSSRNPVQWLLVSVQVALAVTLLVGSGLLLRSFQELGRVSPGFDIAHILTFRISANWGETVDMKKLGQRIDQTLDELRALPGVSAAATSTALPGVPSNYVTEVKITERQAGTEGKVVADSRFVSNGYFVTMQIPVLQGQGCQQSLHNTVVVNRSFANEYFSGSSPIGHHVQMIDGYDSSPFEIRGIAADVREEGLNRAPGPAIYWCTSASMPSPYFLVRTHGNPMTLADAVRGKMQQIQPARSVYDVSPLEQHLSDNFAETRLRTLLLTVFALTAVSLACIGLYGTLSYFVAIRKREVGLRLALGAERREIVANFLLQGIRVALFGSIAGLCLAFGFSKVLSGMLYGVSSTDPQTLLGVVLLIPCVASLACLVPALRASHFRSYASASRRIVQRFSKVTRPLSNSRSGKSMAIARKTSSSAFEIYGGVYVAQNSYLPSS